MMFLISHIQNLCFAFLLPSLNRFECLIFSLGSNESEAEENEVDKPQRKKRTGPKRKKAPQESKVNYSLMTYLLYQLNLCSAANVQ